MARQKMIHSDFTTGEISKKMASRTDLESYKHGARTMLNAYPLPHGACTSRRGTTYVAEVKDSARPSKLITFIYSRTLSYLLVFNGGVMRIVRNGAYITSGGVPYELAIPYTDDDLPFIRFTQIGNSIFIVHKDYFPRKVTRLTETSWTISNLSLTHRAVTDQWFENSIIKFKIISGTTAFKINDSFTITAPGAVVADVAPVNVGNGTIVAVSFPNGTPPTETWTVLCVYADSSRQEWSVTGSVSGTKVLTWSANDYPQTIAFHDQRLYFGGTPTKPQTIWGSAVADYYTFTQGAKDNDALQFTFASNSYDELIHLVSGRYLIPLTYGVEFSLTGSNTTGITPSTVRITPHTYHGANDCNPLKIGNEILFTQRDGLKVRAISYSVAEDTNMASDISVLAEHITASGMKECAFAQTPDYIAWFIRNDGVLASCVHLRDFSMTGWSRHTTDGSFLNVATIPENSQDTVYFVVERLINGSTKRYIEYFNYFEPTYTDCSLKLTSETAQTVWTGLGHLEGKTVAVTSNGYVLPSVTVTSGQITVAQAVTSITVGLPYLPYVQLQHPNIPNEHGTSQGGILSVDKVIVSVQDTLGLKIQGMEQTFRTMNNPLDTALDLYSGDIEQTVIGWSKNQYITFEQPYPLPWTLLSTVLYVTCTD